MLVVFFGFDWCGPTLLGYTTLFRSFVCVRPKKTTSKKKTRQKNMKSRSVTIQIPEKTSSVKIKVPEPEESRSVDDALTPQRLASVAGQPKNRLYIESGASIHILFNKELLGGIVNLDRALKIHAGGKPIHLSQIGSLHQALRHLPLPVSTYHYSENAISNLLSFAKLADDYYIIRNTRVDDAIYVQSKEDGKCLRFQRDHKFNLYYMDISKAVVDEHW